MSEIKEKLRKVDRVSVWTVERAHLKVHKLEPQDVCMGEELFNTARV